MEFLELVVTLAKAATLDIVDIVEYQDIVVIQARRELVVTVAIQAHRELVDTVACQEKVAIVAIQG